MRAYYRRWHGNAIIIMVMITVTMMAMIPVRTSNQINISFILDFDSNHYCTPPEENGTNPCYIPLNVQPRGHGRTYKLHIFEISKG